MNLKVGDKAKLKKGLKPGIKYDGCYYITKMEKYKVIKIRKLIQIGKDVVYFAEENNFLYSGLMLEKIPDESPIEDYSKVTYLDYISKEIKMFKNLGGNGEGCKKVNCLSCPLYSKNNVKNIDCYLLTLKYPEERVKAVMEYVEVEHSDATESTGIETPYVDIKGNKIYDGDLIECSCIYGKVKGIVEYKLGLLCVCCISAENDVYLSECTNIINLGNPRHRNINIAEVINEETKTRQI